MTATSRSDPCSQLTGWHAEWGLAHGPVAPLPINAVAPGIAVSGPAPELVDEIKELQHRVATR